MNKLKILPVLMSLTLSSCDLNAFYEFLDTLLYIDVTDVEKENAFEYGSHSDTGNYVSMINQAFNGKEDINNNSIIGNYEDKTCSYDSEVSTNLSFKKTIKSLDCNDGAIPSNGKIKGLVVPIDFADQITSKFEKQNINVDYQSVASYYYNSSYGHLDMSFDVTDVITTKNNSSYYSNMSEKNQSTYIGEVPGVSAIIHEVLCSLEKVMDLSIYDNDHDGNIDALYIIYNHPIDYKNADFFWAYQYATYQDTTYDGVMPYFYVFASVNFLFENNKNNDPSTFIHETGHLLGLNDYYDYDTTVGYNKGGLGGADMMDNTIGDHNPFSKISLGWQDNIIMPTLETNESTSITINRFDLSCDSILLPVNYNKSKDMFQSYYLLDYFYKDSILNKGKYSYTKSGIRLYRVNAESETETINGNTIVDFKYDNSYTDLNLLDSLTKKGIYSRRSYDDICYDDNDIFSKNDTYGYKTFTSLSQIDIGYKFKVTELTNTTATIMITKI